MLPKLPTHLRVFPFLTTVFTVLLLQSRNISTSLGVHQSIFEGLVSFSSSRDPIVKRETQRVYGHSRLPPTHAVTFKAQFSDTNTNTQMTPLRLAAPNVGTL